MTDEKTKYRAYKAHKSGASSKDLEARFGVSERTIRRWIKSVEEEIANQNQKMEIVSDKKSKSENQNQIDGVINPENQIDRITPEHKRARIRLTGPLSPVEGCHPAETLVQTLKDKGISFSELSRTTGISMACLRGLATNERVGNLATWIVIARALGMSVSEIIGDEA